RDETFKKIAKQNAEKSAGFLGKIGTFFKTAMICDFIVPWPLAFARHGWYTGARHLPIVMICRSTIQDIVLHVIRRLPA
ncbi:MAG: hypothetical protein WAZ45_08770, partial [Gemmiger qucibialis]